MPAPIAVQLYSLRDESTSDFPGVLKKVAGMGFKGVEPFHLFGMRPEEFKHQVEDLGMMICSSHFPWANRAKLGDVASTAHAFGLNVVAGGFGPGDFKDVAALGKTIDTINRLSQTLGEEDLTLFLHNHHWEFNDIDGKPGHHHVAEQCPDVLFEIDTYWAANFGQCDPAAQVSHFRQRTPFLHIKDGPLVPKAANVAVGDGKMDIPSVIGAADPAVLRWLIVKFDACDGDIMEALMQSYLYLTTNSLAQGNR